MQALAASSGDFVEAFSLG